MTSEIDPGRAVIVLPHRAEATDSDVLTVEYKINLVAPAVGERLEAVGEVVKAGRTLIATGQQTVMCLRSRADSAV